MITRLGITSLYVTDYDLAIDFYVNTLGFMLKEDSLMEQGMRWVTIAPAEQPDIEISVIVPQAGMMMTDEQAVALLRVLELKTMCGGVLFSSDIDKDYDLLKAKGVHFRTEPTDQFYGKDAVFEDPFGNWFDLCQPKSH